MSNRLPHALALAAAGATWVMIVAGGLVTNTGSALAVPDWPTTFGENMFVFPWSRMVGGILFEHAHRLLGTLVGLLTLALGLTLWARDRRPAFRTLGLVAILLVSVQGLLGGLRVLWLQEALAIVHGVLAQAFFGVTVALALGTSAAWDLPRRAASLRGIARLGRIAVAALAGQIALGALTTHRGWLTAHLAGAVVVAALLGTLALRAWGGDEPELRRAGRVLGLCLLLQIGLGTGAWLGRFGGAELPGGVAVAVGLPVAHRAASAVLVAATLTAALLAWRWSAPTGADPRGATAARAVSTGAPA